MLNRFCSGICAGLLISAGGCVFLACENRYVGAFFFSVALLCICMKGYSLYTGKICFIVTDARRDAPGAWSVLLWGLAGNTVGTLLSGAAIRYAIPGLGAAAETLCAAKLAAQSVPQTLIRSVFCGMMVYLSVAIYREKNTPAAILLCIPTFILSGFEHSVADMFYFGAAGNYSVQSLVFILAVIVGNSAGGLLLPLLEATASVGRKTVKKEEKK